MDKELIKGWKEEIGKDSLSLNGLTSASKNLDVALNNSECHTDYGIDK